MDQLPLHEMDNLKKLLVSPPVMPWREFSDWIQVSPDTVENWIKRGYLPTVKIGRHRMVNVIQLVHQLLSEDSEV